MTLSERLKKAAEFDQNCFSAWSENARLRPILLELAKLVEVLEYIQLDRRLWSKDADLYDAVLAKLDSVLP